MFIILQAIDAILLVTLKVFNVAVSYLGLMKQDVFQNTVKIMKGLYDPLVVHIQEICVS